MTSLCANFLPHWLYHYGSTCGLAALQNFRLNFDLLKQMGRMLLK